MKLSFLTDQKYHRNWDFPDKPWKWYQEWHQLIFLHWEIDINTLKKYVPKEIEIDTFNEKAWVSLVAFTMKRIRHRNFFSIAFVSNFDEVNIRTYVKKGNKTGVYFLSIEAAKSLSSLIAAFLSKMPYRSSKMQRSKHSFASENLFYNDELNIQYTEGKRIQNKSELDRWLTERYCVIQDYKQNIHVYDVHHIEWPIKNVNINELNVNYQRFKDLINNKPDKVHFSKGVKVLAWDKQIFSNSVFEL